MFVSDQYCAKARHDSTLKVILPKSAKCKFQMSAEILSCDSTSQAQDGRKKLPEDIRSFKVAVATSV